MLSGRISWTECYITTILVPYWDAHHIRFQHRHQQFEHTSATWETQTQVFSLKKSRETVTIISQIGCYVSSIDLGLDRQNSSLAQCHKQNSHGGQLLVHVNVAAVQKPQMLSILHMSLALVTQHAKCMHPVILLSEAFLALPHFSTLSHNTIFCKMLLNIKCVLLCAFTFSTTFVWNISYFKKILVRYYHQYT